MGNGPSNRRNSRPQQAGQVTRVIPLPHTYPANVTYHHTSPSPPPPAANGTQYYQQGYSSGQYLMSLPPHGFSPLPNLTPPLVPHATVPEHQRASTIRNDVNLKKATLQLEEDRENAGCYLVSFSFDATVPGSVSIFFLAKEGTNCSLTPLKPHIYKPTRSPFGKGLGQNFRQLPGCGVNLSLFDPYDLSKDGDDDVYGLVVRTESVRTKSSCEDYSGEPVGAPLPKWLHSQITHAVVERREDGQYRVRVVKQIIWVDGVRYELQEIYGIENNAELGFDGGNGDGKECVICLSEPRDTTVLPCRHMCMCSECAKVLRFQTNRCPICRCSVEQLLEIKVPKNDTEQQSSI